MVKVNRSKMFALLLSAMLLLIGCGSTNDINNTPSEKLRKDLCRYSSSNKVDVTYTAPILYIQINLSDDNTASVYDVFDMVKTFTNDSTIKEMGLGLDTDVHLTINTMSATYTYSTSYYKTNDTTDNSPENIIDYKVWIEGCIIYHSN